MQGDLVFVLGGIIVILLFIWSAKEKNYHSGFQFPWPGSNFPDHWKCRFPLTHLKIPWLSPTLKKYFFPDFSLTCDNPASGCKKEINIYIYIMGCIFLYSEMTSYKTKSSHQYNNLHQSADPSSSHIAWPWWAMQWPVVSMTWGSDKLGTILLSWSF